MRPHWLDKFICWLMGHDDEDAPFVQEGAWSSDSACARCGERIWWAL